VSRGLAGHLDLFCAPDARGISILREQSFRAPMHISKPHHDAGTLVVNVVNPTAGWLEGDAVTSRIRVAAGARLLLTTPSASRAHRMASGCAHLEQTIHIEPGAFLEFWPELFIPQSGSAFRQATSIRIEPGGSVLFFESLAPGRVAFGECYAFRRFEWSTEISIGQTPAVIERVRLAPESPAIQAIRDVFPHAYYASGFIFSPALSDASPCWERIHALHNASCWTGCGRLPGGGWLIKCLAEGSIPLRQALATIRGELYASLNRPAPSLRRT
jgi:urease accessory protein